jgi:hypothetical protein
VPSSSLLPNKPEPKSAISDTAPVSWHPATERLLLPNRARPLNACNWVESCRRDQLALDGSYPTPDAEEAGRLKSAPYLLYDMGERGHRLLVQG